MYVKSRASFGLDHLAQFPLFDFCHGAEATFGPRVEIARRYVQHTKERPKSVDAHISNCMRRARLQNNHNTFETHMRTHTGH